MTGGGTNMANPNANGLAAVWEQVKDWPAAERIALASRIMQSLETTQYHEPTTAPVPRKTLADLWGCMATDQPPPSDEEVDRIIEGEIMGKYG